MEVNNPRRMLYETMVALSKGQMSIQKEFIGNIKLIKVNPEYAYESVSTQNSWNKQFNRKRYANTVPKYLGVKVKYHNSSTFLGKCRDLVA